MELQTIITANHLTKAYWLYAKPFDRVREAFSPFRHCYHQEFYALNNVSFQVYRGETVGIIGRNGSGKSTLLKILTGLVNPTSGSVAVNGKVSALLELGAGFNPEMTGYENVFLTGVINGLSREQVEARLDDILSFADIGEFINQPVKTYSSGMQVRLAFSVATAIEPELLIVDEALSVGDFRFQAKCTHRIRRMMENNCTTLFVSHEMNTVKRLCKRVMYFEAGHLKEIGESTVICDMYIKDQLTASSFFAPSQSAIPEMGPAEESAVEAAEGEFMMPSCENFFTEEDARNFEQEVAYLRRGNGTASFVWVEIINDLHQRIAHLKFGHKYTVRLFFKVAAPVEEMVIAFYLRDKNQIEVIGGNNLHQNLQITDLVPEAQYSLTFSFHNFLKSGVYSLYCLIVDAIPTTVFFDRIENALVISSEENPHQPPRWAIYNPPLDATLERFGEQSIALDPTG